MAIYPERKAGVLTGRFRVEIQQGTKRLRGPMYQADFWF